MSTDNANTPRVYTFERVLRECGHNEQLTRKGSTRGFIYDFKAILNGQHIAWWSQYGPNGQTDAGGGRYWLKDKMWHPVKNDRDVVKARNREEFESVLVANLCRIPSDGELAQCKLDEDRKEENRKAAQDAATAKYRMEQAAPEMLSALKADLDGLNRILYHYSTALPEKVAAALNEMRLKTGAAISKAEERKL